MKIGMNALKRIIAEETRKVLRENSQELLKRYGVHSIDMEYLCTELGCESPDDIEVSVHRTPRGSKLMAGLRGTRPTYHWDAEGGWVLSPEEWATKQWG